MNSMISYVKCEYNIAFLQQMRKNIPLSASLFLNSMDQLLLQDKISEYIVDNQSSLDLNFKLSQGTAKSYPVFFALIIAFISDFENCSSFDECLRQCDRTFLQSIDAYQEKRKCLCSHSCLSDNLYKIRNAKTHSLLIIGETCATKY